MSKTKTTIAIISFPILCLLLSLYVLRTDTAFTTSLLENKEAVQPTKQLIEHFYGNAKIPDVFNEQEKAHLVDVRRLLHYAEYLLELFAALFVFCAIGNWHKTTKYGTILLAAILLFSATIQFDSFFTKFHQIFFPQGNWQFPPDSMLIQFYPETFFANYAAAIAIHALIAAAFLYYIGIVSRK